MFDCEQPGSPTRSTHNVARRRKSRRRLTGATKGHGDVLGRTPVGEKSTELFGAISPKTFSITEKHELSHVKFTGMLELSPRNTGGHRSSSSPNTVSPRKCRRL